MVQVLRLKNYRILCSFPIFPLLLVSTLLRHLDLIEDRSAIGSQKVDPRSRRIIFFVFLSKKLYLQPEVWLGSGELSRKSNRKLGCISHSGGIAIFVNRLFCDWQSEPAICDDVLVSSFTSFMIFIYNLMQTHAIPYSLVGFVASSRSREHNFPCSHGEKDYFVYIHILTRIFKNLKVITL